MINKKLAGSSAALIAAVGSVVILTGGGPSRARPTPVEEQA